MTPVLPEAGPDQRALREVGGDVEVEILPDLDVIILRGRQRDVDEMSRIIAEIERLSAETVPQIEILPLEHVKDTTMVRIITQVSPDLIGGRQGRATVLPLDKPNALLLIGWEKRSKSSKLWSKNSINLSSPNRNSVFSACNTQRQTWQEELSEVSSQIDQG